VQYSATAQISMHTCLMGQYPSFAKNSHTKIRHERIDVPEFTDGRQSTKTSGADEILRHINDPNLFATSSSSHIMRT
jgi:hypothetical protein